VKSGPSNECIMIGSYYHSNSLESFNHTNVAGSEFRQWFWPPPTRGDINVQSISETTQRNKRSRVPLRRDSKLDNSPADTPQNVFSDLKWWLKVHHLWWIFSIIGSCATETFFVVYAFLGFALLAPLAALAIGLLGIAFGLLISALLIVPLVVALIMVLMLLFQTTFNLLVSSSWKWYFWDSFVSTHVGKLLESKTIHVLPATWQRLFYRTFSKPSVPKDMSVADWKKYGGSQGDRYKIINIMLISRRCEDGREVCERLAIGAMSASEWWKSKPRRREITLR
jgi:hypothetical protein